MPANLSSEQKWLSRFVVGGWLYEKRAWIQTMVGIILFGCELAIVWNLWTLGYIKIVVSLFLSVLGLVLFPIGEAMASLVWRCVLLDPQRDIALLNALLNTDEKSLQSQEHAFVSKAGLEDRLTALALSRTRWTNRATALQAQRKAHNDRG